MIIPIIAGNAFHGCWVLIWAVGSVLALLIVVVVFKLIFGRDRRKP